MKAMYVYDIGDIVGDLECIDIKKPAKGSGDGTRYLMRCKKCGREKWALGATLFRKSGITHKACGKGLKTVDKRFHSLWCAMRTRTTNPNYQHYEDYGARGINSDAFENFIDFYDTMYESYVIACKKYGTKNVSLERIDANGNYCPENCEWIDIHKQPCNCRNTINFIARSPGGLEYKGRNLMEFTRSHGLDYNSSRDVLIGRNKHHKHWTFRYAK